MRISDAEAPTLSFNRGTRFPSRRRSSIENDDDEDDCSLRQDEVPAQSKVASGRGAKPSFRLQYSNPPTRRHADTPTRRHADTPTRSPDVPLPLGFQMKKMFFKRPSIRFSCNGQNWNH
jgi:hypothetical protein